jgi:hypothetical protein
MIGESRYDGIPTLRRHHCFYVQNNIKCSETRLLFSSQLAVPTGLYNDILTNGPWRHAAPSLLAGGERSVFVGPSGEIGFLVEEMRMMRMNENIPGCQQPHVDI